MPLRFLSILAFAAGLPACGQVSAPPPAAGSPPAPAAIAAGRSPPSQLGLCATCHGRDGVAVVANAPSLAGRDRDDLLRAMQTYLDGTRDYPPMRAMLGPIRPADRERLADWFAAQPPPAGRPAS